MLKRFIIFLLLITPVMMLQAQAVWGDVNNSGKADIIDALMTAQYSVGLNPQGFNVEAADVNADGKVSIVDALMIAQYYVGIYTPPATKQTVNVKPDHSAIYYTGRIDFSKPAEPSFAYSGVSIKARFTGTGIDVIMRDQSDRNYFYVIIDNGTPAVIRSAANQTTYQAARNLTGTTHTIEIFKRTEANLGKAVFLGFTLYESSGLVEWGTRPGRKMEFIGDSITCGYGNEVSTTDPGSYPFTPEKENAYLAYGAVAARDLNAEYRAMCYSGKGLFRNYDASETNTIPVMYERIFPDENAPLWNFPAPAPDVVVINLGTNDYSSQVTKSDLSQTEMDARIKSCYLGLLKNVRNRYGNNTRIVCAVGPMMSDSYPSGTSSWTRIQNLVSSMVNGSGDSRLYYLKFDPQSSPYGEDWHPTAATHRQMADRLVTFVKQITGWN